MGTFPFFIVAWIFNQEGKGQTGKVTNQRHKSKGWAESWRKTQLYSRIDLHLFYYIRAEVNLSTNIYLESITGSPLLSYKKITCEKVKQEITGNIYSASQIIKLLITHHLWKSPRIYFYHFKGKHNSFLNGLSPPNIQLMSQLFA